jgi:hypothetical protein
MNLSDAILKGCELRPTACRKSWFFVESIHPLQIASCVMGAAYEGLYGPIQAVVDQSTQQTTLTIDQPGGITGSLRKQFPVMAEKVSKYFGEHLTHSEDWGVAPTVDEYIIHLNDDCGWTRQQIAAFVKYVIEGQPMIPED